MLLRQILHCNYTGDAKHPTLYPCDAELQVDPDLGYYVSQIYSTVTLLINNITLKVLILQLLSLISKAQKAQV